MAYTKTILPQNEGKEIKNEDKSKYEKALELYDTNLNDAEVQAAVKKIIEEKVPQNDTMEVKKFLFGSIELTTLSTTDTEEKVLKMIEKVNQFESTPIFPMLQPFVSIPSLPNSWPIALKLMV